MWPKTIQCRAYYFSNGQMAEGHLAFLLKQTDQIHDIENN